MTTATLKLHRVQKNLQSEVKSADLPTTNWKIFCYIGFFLSLSLLIFYVFQVNYLAKGFYTVKSYDKQISQLSEENKNLQVSYAESSLLDQALIKIKALNFQKTTSVKYLQILDNSVATAKR